MAFVNFTSAVAGQVATASFYNNNLSALASQFNGNVDATNLANLAVTAAKIASNAITTVKLALGVVLGLTTVTAASNDFVMISDTSDSGNVKKALISDIATPATQAEMEAASSTTAVVTPGRTQYHPGVSKAWIKFNGTGTPTIDASHNVTSITDNGTGDYTLNWTTAFSSSNYGAVGSAGESGVISGARVTLATFATGSLRIFTPNTSNVATDYPLVAVAAWGDQ